MEHSLLLLLFLPLLCILYRTTTAIQTAKSYIVYMGSSTSSSSEKTMEAVETAHLEFSSSTLESKERERLSLIHVYNHAFKGFSTMLTEEEASVLSGHGKVISVFPDPTLQLRTTRSWDFLKAESGVSSNHRYPTTSVGMSAIFQSDFLNDPVAIGAFHASQKNILVVCSGRNDGPDPSTVVNSAPCIFTVAASNIDRDSKSSVVLENGHVFKGSTINFFNLTTSKLYPPAFGGNIAAPSTPWSEARNCLPGSLDTKNVVGKIIVCIDTNQMVSRKIKKLVVWVSSAGLVKGLDLEPRDRSSIFKYINSTKNPAATILATVDVKLFRPAPVVVYFSSRGPGDLTKTILKVIHWCEREIELQSLGSTSKPLTHLIYSLILTAPGVSSCYDSNF